MNSLGWKSVSPIWFLRCSKSLRFKAYMDQWHIKNAGSQAPPQTYLVSHCSSARSPGDLCANSSLRNSGVNFPQGHVPVTSDAKWHDWGNRCTRSLFSTGVVGGECVLLEMLRKGELLCADAWNFTFPKNAQKTSFSWHSFTIEIELMDVTCLSDTDYRIQNKVNRNASLVCNYLRAGYI